WATFRHDYQRTGHTSVVGPQRLDILKWKRQVVTDPDADSEGFVRSSPAIGINGEVYITASYPKGPLRYTVLVCYGADGQKRWASVPGQGITYSTPSVTVELLYIGAPDGGVKSIGTGSLSPIDGGVVRWTSGEATQLVLASPALSQDEKTVYVGTHD